MQGMDLDARRLDRRLSSHPQPGVPASHDREPGLRRWSRGGGGSTAGVSQRRQLPRFFRFNRAAIGVLQSQAANPRAALPHHAEEVRRERSREVSDGGERFGGARCLCMSLMDLLRNQV